jgi:hypothetical protein
MNAHRLRGRSKEVAIKDNHANEDSNKDSNEDSNEHSNEDYNEHSNEGCSD